MLIHRNICINLQAMCQMLYIGPTIFSCPSCPCTISMNAPAASLSVYRGATVRSARAYAILQRKCRKSKVTIMLAVPLMLELFYKADHEICPPLIPDWRKNSASA
jgi:long-subunit acyl-CoA synthetase (AMP-forming)